MAAAEAADALQAVPPSAADAASGDPPPGAVHFPLEGGPPRVATPAADVAPGVSKQVMARGRDEPPPARDDKCFGAPRRREASRNGSAASSHGGCFLSLLETG